MEIRELQNKSKEIWGDEKLSLTQILVRLGKVYGDICRWERNAIKDKETHTDKELKKEFGNLIFASIKFCDELGYDPEECISLAIKCQEEYVADGNK
jgi:hypothetical protein